MSNPEPLFFDTTKDDYKRGIFNAIVAPRPIGWMSTLGPDGRANLAPFSYFNIMSNHPPVLAFSCNTPEDRDAKDTLTNVRTTGEFVYNLVGLDLVEVMNRTSTPVPYGVDEFEFAGVEKASCRFVAPPRVARSACSMECKVIRIISLGGGKLGPETNVTFGHVVGVHIAAGFLSDAGRFETSLANPVARLGGAEYAVPQPAFELRRQFTRANEDTY